MTPARVSQTARILERRLGGQLFSRTSRRVSLTPLGERLQARIRPAYDRMEQAIADTCEETTGIAGQLRIGTYMPISYGPHFLEIVKAFEARHVTPPVTCDHHRHRVYRSVRLLHRGEFDVLAMRLPISNADVTIGPTLSDEPRIAVVALDHPLAKRESVCLEGRP